MDSDLPPKAKKELAQQHLFNSRGAASIPGSERLGEIGRRITITMTII
jgi:hypothetical protein